MTSAIAWLSMVLFSQSANAKLTVVIYKPALVKEAEQAIGHWFMFEAMDKKYESLPDETRQKVREGYYKKNLRPLESNPTEESRKEGEGTLLEFERMARWDMGLVQGPYPGQDN
jgi:hypothetical protein